MYCNCTDFMLNLSTILPIIMENYMANCMDCGKIATNLTVFKILMCFHLISNAFCTNHENMLLITLIFFPIIFFAFCIVKLILKI